MRCIQLFHPRYNTINKVLGRRVQINAEEVNAIEPDQYGTRKHHKAICALLNKVILNNIFRQRKIAGALAKRIVNYAKEGEKVVQGTDAGFIKFGSRVDIFLPLNTKLNVQLVGDQNLQCPSKIHSEDRTFEDPSCKMSSSAPYRPCWCPLSV